MSTTLPPVPGIITPPATVVMAGCTATFAAFAFISRFTKDSANVFTAFDKTIVASVSE